MKFVSARFTGVDVHRWSAITLDTILASMHHSKLIERFRSLFNAALVERHLQFSEMFVLDIMDS